MGTKKNKTQQGRGTVRFATASGRECPRLPDPAFTAMTEKVAALTSRLQAMEAEKLALVDLIRLVVTTSIAETAKSVRSGGYHNDIASGLYTPSFQP